MKITADHWLDLATKKILPGGAVMNTRRFLVIHFTEGWTAEQSIEFWRTPDANGTSAHIVIDRDGAIFQCRPFNRTCGHAGKNSRWKDPTSGITYRNRELNECSIGVELANCGALARAVYPSTMPSEWKGREIPRLRAAHKNGGRVKAWEKFDLRQLDACEMVSELLVARYNLDDVVGHDDVAPSWKEDPGPAFPMAELRSRLGFPRP